MSRLTKQWSRPRQWGLFGMRVLYMARRLTASVSPTTAQMVNAALLMECMTGGIHTMTEEVEEDLLPSLFSSGSTKYTLVLPLAEEICRVDH